MKLPSNYQNLMSKMYDKEIEVYSSVEKVDEELNSVAVKGSLKEKVQCNIHYTSKEAVLRDFGLNLETSLYFTCQTTLAVENDFICYENEDYKVVGILKFDTHTKVFVKNV